MFKTVLDSLDKAQDDGLMERIEKEAISKKYWIALGGSIVFLMLGFVLNGASMYKGRSIPSATVNTVIQKSDGTLDVSKIEKIPITLPFAHQTFKNVSNWIVDAISVTYSFDFLNIEEQIKKSEFYFTPEGYKMYVNSIEKNQISKQIKSKFLSTSIIPLQSPVLINGGVSGGTEFWRFRVPVLVSYAGGKDPVISKYMMELLILRVPSYISHKGLAIAEYNMLSN
jgi:Type-IV b secretion system, inner-membrane complex component